MKKRLLSCFSLLFAITSFSQNNPVVIPGSQTLIFTSSYVQDQAYALQVSLPASYGKTNKTYPVVYLMDSQWDFPLVTALYGQQYYDGFIPEVIIVGITWGGDHPNPDSLRARDYTPTNEKRLPQSGGADAFLSVIKNEVFPLINKSYRADTADQTLMGCSLGGLFTMYTLFTHPMMFNRYIAASPAFTWDNNVLYQYEKKYHDNPSNPKAKLFMCVGGVETSAPAFQKLTQFLSDRHYNNLQVENRVLDNIGHSGTKGEGYERGLQSVFGRPSLSLSQEQLRPYIGTYQLDNGMQININEEKGSLLFSSGNESHTLLASSDTDFYLTSSFFNIHFIKEKDGSVKEFHLNRYGSSERAEKVK